MEKPAQLHHLQLILPSCHKQESFSLEGGGGSLGCRFLEPSTSAKKQTWRDFPKSLAYMGTGNSFIIFTTNVQFQKLFHQKIPVNSMDTVHFPLQLRTWMVYQKTMGHMVVESYAQRPPFSTQGRRAHREGHFSYLQRGANLGLRVAEIFGHWSWIFLLVGWKFED